jgi:hypothetical protein
MEQFLENLGVRHERRAMLRDHPQNVNTGFLELV